MRVAEFVIRGRNGTVQGKEKGHTAHLSGGGGANRVNKVSNAIRGHGFSGLLIANHVQEVFDLDRKSVV